jgi:hypothetical protein
VKGGDVDKLGEERTGIGAIGYTRPPGAREGLQPAVA